MISRVRIAGVGAALPEAVVLSSDIEQELALPSGWCEQTTGVRERGRALQETTLSLAAEAARRLGVHKNTLTNYLHKEQPLDRKTRLAMAAILRGLSEFRGSSN